MSGSASKSSQKHVKVGNNASNAPGTGRQASTATTNGRQASTANGRQASINNSVHVVIDDYVDSNDTTTKYPKCNYKDTRYQHGNDRLQEYTSRFKNVFRVLFNHYVSNSHFVKEDYPACAVLAFDIVTILGGNRRRSDGSFVDPMIITGINEDIINYALSEYGHDHRLAFSINDRNIPSDDVLKAMYKDILVAYIKYRSDGNMYTETLYDNTVYNNDNNKYESVGKCILL